MKTCQALSAALQHSLRNRETGALPSFVLAAITTQPGHLLQSLSLRLRMRKRQPLTEKLERQAHVSDAPPRRPSDCAARPLRCRAPSAAAGAPMYSTMYRIHAGASALVRARLCASMREYTVASRALELVHTSDSNWFLACCRLATVFSVSACRFAKAST